MSTSQENKPGDRVDEARLNRIDRTAPAGSENSLGAQSVRDGRPGTDDGVVEAIDEEGPGTSAQPTTDKDGVYEQAHQTSMSRQPEDRQE